MWRTVLTLSDTEGGLHFTFTCFLNFQIVTVSTKRLMHNWPGLKASTAVYSAAERSKREWIPFIGRTETRLHDIYAVFYIPKIFIVYNVCLFILVSTCLFEELFVRLFVCSNLGRGKTWIVYNVVLSTEKPVGFHPRVPLHGEKSLLKSLLYGAK